MNKETKQKIIQALIDGVHIFTTLNIQGGQSKQGATILAIFEAVLKELEKIEEDQSGVDSDRNS